MSYLASLNPLNLLGAMPGNVAQGLIWGLMALGVYITFRLLDFADLTVDGSFATGGAVTVVLILHGWSVPAALLIAILAGLAAGLVYRAIAWGGKSHSSGRMLGGSIAAGIVSPVVNTGLFLLGLFFLFPTYLEAWATGAGQTVITYMIFTMVSINFVLELLINLVLSTVIVRVVSARSHS